MKRLLLLAFLAGCILCEAKAQDIAITGVMPGSFSGVRPVNNGEQYFIAFMDAAAQDSASVALRLFDRGMQLKREINIPVAKGTQLVTTAFTGQFYIVQFVNAGNKTRTTMVVDEGGNTFKRKDETDIKASALSAANLSTFFPISPNDYVAVRTNRDGKPVFELEAMNTEFNSRWQKSFESGNGAEILDFRTEMDRVFILQKGKAGGKEIYSVHSLSGITGDNFFSTEIREADNIAVPGYFTVENGFITTAGVFHKESTPEKPEGVFIARMDPAGRPEKMVFAPWSVVKTQLKNSLIADLEAGKVGMQVQNAIPDAAGDGLTLVGELYKKTAGPEANTATFSVQDFVLVHINKEGQADKINQFSKPTREVLVKGPMSSRSAVELAQWMNRNRFFGYRATVPAAGRTVIAYLDQKKDKTTAYFAAIDSTGAVPEAGISQVSLDRQNVEPENGRQKTKSTEIDVTVLNSSENDLQDFSTSRISKNIALVQDGHVLITAYTDPELRLLIMPVPVRENR